MNSLNIPFIAEIITLVIGMVAWKKLQPQQLRIILVLLLVTVVNEGVIVFFELHTRFSNLLYNLFSFVEMGCWGAFFYQTFSAQKNIQKIILVMIGCSIVFSLVELSVYRNWFRFHGDSYRFYSLGLIMFCVLYLLGMIRADKILVPTSDPVFWCCAGILVFNSVFFVHLTVVNIPVFGNDPESMRIFHTLLNLANIIYYTLLCAAFYTSLRNHQPSSLHR